MAPVAKVPLTPPYDWSNMIIDVHAHILTLDLVAKLNEAGFSRQLSIEPVDDEMVMIVFSDNGQRFGPVPRGLIDLDQRITDMDRQGVDVQALGAVPMTFGHAEDPAVGAAMSSVTNDTLLEIARNNPSRFHVMASLPMQDPRAAVIEIRRVAEDSLVRGVQIAPHVNDGHLDDPQLDDVWAELERQDLPMLLHPAPPTPAGARLKNYHLRNFIGNPLDSTIGIGQLVFGGVLQRFPELRVGLVHGGGFWPYQTGRWDHGWERRPESKAHIHVKPSTFYGQVYCDTLTHNGDSLRFLGGRVGWDHLMIGTDYPFDMAEVEPVRSVEAIDLAPENLRKVLHETAESFLRTR